MAQPPSPWRRGLAAMAGLLGLLGAPGPAGASSLKELGFPEGFILQGPRASAEVFFPLPTVPSRPELVLDLLPSGMLDEYSSISVYANGSPLVALPLRDGPRTERIPIPPGLARGEFLPIRIVADQALRRDDVCFDNDTPGVWTRIAAESGLEYGVEGSDGIGAVWRQLAGEVRIALPGLVSLPDIEAAVTLATALTARGATPVMVGPEDSTAHIRIGRAAAPLALETTMGGLVRLRVSDTSAARALVAAAPVMRTLDSAAASGAPLPVVATPMAESVSFAEIGLIPAPVGIYSSGTLTLEIPFDRLPPGRRPVALRLFGRGPTVPPGEVLAASISVGGRLLWSESYRGSMALEGLDIPLPADLLRHRMSVTLRLSRLGVRRACTTDDALPFHLRDTSRVILADGHPPAVDFGGFAFNGERPALVRVDVAPNEAVAAVPLLGRLLASAAARPAAIEVTGGTPLNRNFILLARAAPAEVTGAGLVRPDLGRVVLEDQRNGTRVEVSPASGLTVVQLVQSGPVAGLWVSPGAERSFAAPAALSTGNVAVYDGAGRPTVLDTRRPTVAVEEARLLREANLFDRWRNELFLLAWVLITLLAVLAVVRLRRRRS